MSTDDDKGEYVLVPGDLFVWTYDDEAIDRKIQSSTNQLHGLHLVIAIHDDQLIALCGAGVQTTIRFRDYDRDPDGSGYRMQKVV